MPNYLSDVPLPTNIPAERPAALRVAVLQALFDAHVNGTIGTPQERFATKRRKVINQRLMARVAPLNIHDKAKVLMRMNGGEKLKDILADMGVPE